jgi:hypothetical protein
VAKALPHKADDGNIENRRPLATIVGEIRGTFRADVGNVIRRGELLIEAKEQVEHGQWLAWLDQNFEMDDRTAQRAMAAAEFAAKYDTVSILNLSVSALYDLSAGCRSLDVVAAAMAEAATKPVNRPRLWGIVGELAPPVDAETRRRVLGILTDAEVEAKAILDGPPPTQESILCAQLTAAFRQLTAAIQELKDLSTKSFGHFAGIKLTADELDYAANFLMQLKTAIEKQDKSSPTKSIYHPNDGGRLQ